MAETDAYLYTDKLKEDLIKNRQAVDISKEFDKIKDNAGRVKFLENELLKRNIFPKLSNLKQPKSNEKAVLYRKQGNKYYEKKDFGEALEYYNKSICFSELGSENLGLGFANRSAVYFEMNFYQKCLDNIELAKKNSYPEKSIDKLNKRYENCKLKIESDQNISPDMIMGADKMKMSLPVNPKIPYVAECLRMKSDETFGRYVITTTNLKAGDIIAIEEPFSKCLIPDPKVPYQFCANCLNENALDLIPCKHCTLAMFCSEICLIEGTKKFHQYECDIIDKSNEISTKIMKIANFTFFEALDMYGGIENFMRAAEENAGSLSTVFDFDLSNDKNKKENLFLAIDSLASNEQYRTSADLFQRAGIVAIMTHIYLNYTQLKNVLDSDEAKNFYRQFVFRQTQIAAINYHGIYDGASSDKYGSGSFAFCSLINHSCAPNLVRVSYQCKNFVLVNRPIHAGQQLFDNYGYHHCLETFTQRQKGLKDQYMFTCTCEACTGNYPLFPALKSVTNDFDMIFNSDIEKLADFDHKTAFERVKVFCEYLNKLDRKYPCREISSLQECLLRCFFLFKLTAFKGCILLTNLRN